MLTRAFCDFSFLACLRFVPRFYVLKRQLRVGAPVNRTDVLQNKSW